VFPGFDRLYVASDPLADRPFRAKLEGDFDDACLLVRGEQRAETLSASRAMGERVPGDVVWTTWAIPLLLAQPAVDACRAANFSGWTTLPVALKDGHGDDRSFHLLVVTGRCGPIDYARSAREWTIYPGGRFPALRGFYFDEDSWDGSDFFMETRDTGWIFVTERVVQLFRTNKFRNVRFERLDEIEIDADIV